MSFTKIQPQQLQMPTFFSDSGDFTFSDQITGYKANLNRNLTGDFNFGGTILFNSKRPVVLDDSVLFDTGFGNMDIGGFDNTISGTYSSIIGGKFI